MNRMLFSWRAWALGSVLFTMGLAPSVAAQEASDPEPKVTLGLSTFLGTQTIVEGNTNPVNYDTFGFIPDLGYGPLGIGVDLSFHFQFFQQPGGPFGIYPRAQDWWDSSLSLGQNINKYLARLAYLRWGHPGDPLYAQVGLVPPVVLGTGFLVGGYTNGTLRPEIDTVGLDLDAKGEVIQVPWLEFQSFVGNVAAFDVVGGRLSVQPWEGIQIGVTVAADTNPYAQLPNAPNQVSGSVLTEGLDVIVPWYTDPLFSAATTGDVALEGSNAGGSVGLQGKAFGTWEWGLQNRFLGNNFVPDYFDQGYELNRVDKLLLYNGTISVPGTLGWEGSLGTAFLGDAVTVGLSLSGPWTAQSSVYVQPSLQSYARVKSGLLPLDLSAFYIKDGLNGWADLGSLQNVLLGVKVGYSIDSVTLSVVSSLHYLSDSEVAANGLGPNGNRWLATSRIETSVRFN